TPVAINSSLTIDGPGADLLTISGNDASRIFIIVFAGDVVIRGMTLTEGRGVGTGGAGAGRAILSADSTTLRLEGCVVTGNRSGGQGGGMALYNSSIVTIRDCTISDNIDEGNGFVAGGILHSAASLTIVNSTISNNQVTSSTSMIAAAGIAGQNN